MIYALVKGLTLGVLLMISVGPILFTIIKQSINNGTKGGLAFISGVALSDLLLSITANLFTALFNSILARKELVGIVGCIFLVSAGVYFLFFKKVKANEDGKQVLIFRKRDYAKLFITGFLMNILNPGIWVFWLATATTFATHTVKERVVIFGVALVFVALSDIAKVLLANKLRQRMTVKNIQFISKLNGAILIGFGFFLLWGMITFGGKFAH